MNEGMRYFSQNLLPPTIKSGSIILEPEAHFHLTQALGCIMSAISEDTWCAGWLDGCEDMIPYWTDMQPSRELATARALAKSRKNKIAAQQPEDHMTWHSLGEEPPLIVDMSNWENDDE